MIIKITRENSSYREKERENIDIYMCIYIIFAETNQPTNQPNNTTASKLLPTKTETASSFTRLESSARSLARSSHAGFVWSMLVWRYFFGVWEKNRNRNRNRNLCETRTWSFLSIPLQNRVGCERASLHIPFSSTPLRVLSSLLLRLRFLPV